MSTRRRVFLTGSQRAEFEHIHGPVPVDETDPRFALLTEEEEALVFSLPSGVPASVSQSADDRAAIRAHEELAGDFEGSDPSDREAVKVEPVKREDAAKAEGGSAPASPREPVGATATSSGSSGNSPDAGTASERKASSSGSKGSKSK